MLAPDCSYPPTVDHTAVVKCAIAAGDFNLFIPNATIPAPFCREFPSLKAQSSVPRNVHPRGPCHEAEGVPPPPIPIFAVFHKKFAGNSRLKVRPIRSRCNPLSLQQVDRLGEVGGADVLGQGGMLAFERQVHLPGHPAVTEVAGGPERSSLMYWASAKSILKRQRMRVASGSK